ncbi:MAG TPA: efflux RND transporter periplasmic adaptor subunit, partial [Holophaga sp.]|nr:efflux RND transporter periplasmic adaptor subunit [Holophaga sp.]
GLAVGVVLVGGSAGFYAFRKSEDAPKWRTAAVERGDIRQRISATGSLSALIQVPVGTQVSGVISGLYADYNSLVKKGQVIARIDPTVWETQLQDAKAGLQRAQVAYANAKLDYGRYRKLHDQSLVADADLDLKDLALKTAEGNVASAKANLDHARISLGYCTITAPVNGVVVARLVDEGQTVAASYSTPNLFTIAQDLSRLKVQVAIDESDIGQVRVGQRSFFTVDSYPDSQFQGVVTEVQLNPVVNQNVVTYNVVMEVDNSLRSAMDGQAAGGERRRGGQGQAPQSDRGQARARGGKPEGLPQPSHQADLEHVTARYIPAGSPVYQGDFALFPGMTANCIIITNLRKGVLRVPNIALRFNPSAFLKDEPAAGRPAGQGQGTGKGLAARREDHLWVLDNGKPKSIIVKAGISDGQFTEVSGDLVQEGLQVLTGAQDLKKATNGSAVSPFGGPGMPRH